MSGPHALGLAARPKPEPRRREKAASCSPRRARGNQSDLKISSVVPSRMMSPSLNWTISPHQLVRVDEGAVG